MLIQKPRLPIIDIILIGILPGFLKKFFYRLKGYKIGKGVSIGLGSVLCAKNILIGNYTKIGFLTIIRGESIKIGAHVNIGSMTFIDTPFVEIGDESKINEEVFIGGLQFHDSKFILGRNSQIMQFSFINPAKSITIGDDTCLGGHCLLFGHNSWLSQLDGYDVVFKPITIGNNVGLSWRVFVLPGSSIGDGSVIAPHSVVNQAIPPMSLAAGFPARVIAKPPSFPKEVTDEEKINILKDIVEEMIRYFTGSGLVCKACERHYEITQTIKSVFKKKNKIWRLYIIYEDIIENIGTAQNEPFDVLVSLKPIPIEVRKRLNSERIMWLDIQKRERPLFWNDIGDEAALFLRRYGIRFNRVKE